MVSPVRGVRFGRPREGSRDIHGHMPDRANADKAVARRCDFDGIPIFRDEPEILLIGRPELM
jgi:hypothetical protein